MGTRCEPSGLLACFGSLVVASLVTEHLDLARHLFLLAGDLPLSQQDYNGRLTELLCLLHTAMVFSATAGRTDLVDETVRLWPAAYRAWNDAAPTWGDTATRLGPVDKPEPGPQTAE